MALMIDYFVCSKAEMLSWGAALSRKDDRECNALEASMAAVAHLCDVTHTDINLLSQLADALEVDSQIAARSVDLLLEIGPDGPWIFGFRDSAIKSICGLSISDEVTRLWANASADFTGSTPSKVMRYLNKDSAEKIQSLCLVSSSSSLPLWTCFYG